MGKQLTPRQTQATIMPASTVAHVRPTAHCRKVHGFDTALYVTVVGGRIRWCASVSRQVDGHVVPLEVMSHKQLKNMEQLAREMLYLREPRGQSVGKGNHQVAPGQFSVNIYRELTDDEIKLLPEDWQKYPEAGMEGVAR